MEGERQLGHTDGNELSPRRLMPTNYVDSEDVTSKRKEANMERKKEYNDYIRGKVGHVIMCYVYIILGTNQHNP